MRHSRPWACFAGCQPARIGHRRGILPRKTFARVPGDRLHNRRTCRLGRAWSPVWKALFHPRLAPAPLGTAWIAGPPRSKGSTHEWQHTGHPHESSCGLPWSPTSKPSDARDRGQDIHSLGSCPHRNSAGTANPSPRGCQRAPPRNAPQLDAPARACSRVCQGASKRSGGARFRGLGLCSKCSCGQTVRKRSEWVRAGLHACASVRARAQA